MKHYRLFYCALSMCLLTLWTACTVENADNEIAMPGEEKPSNTDSTQTLTVAEKELQENYELLYFYFIDATQKLGDIHSYMGHGEEAGYSPSRFEYPDVYYMYSKMGDSYTFYIGPYYVGKYDLDMESDPSYNLAVSVEKAESQLVITQVFPNGPGSKAGLKEKDTILYVGSSNPGSAKDFETLTTGSEGDSISLKILRGPDTLDISAKLFCYLNPTVFLSYRDSIPVIKITGFENFSATSCSDANNANDVNSFKGTKDEISTVLKATKGQTIIDLRGNPGGSIDACFSAAELFLSKGDTIARLEYTDVAPDNAHQMIINQSVVASEDGVGKGRYFVFLADSNSASCAETMLMGVTNTTKSPIVGMLTYGKGIGQYYIPTSAGGYSIITAMRVYDKNGFFYHDKGIVPDYNIADSTKALDKAVEIAKLAKEKRTQGYGSKELGHFNNSLAKKASFSNEPFKGGAYRIIKNPFAK